ncbi:hypothetical protein GQ44DRAFT_712764 [Phaeosphaeriaceae sp. PMI808]|nr:hypothetical protein GQ44DRAFT_712764 [Phaeosphaeriaceae sp. PMI808]
MKMQIGADWIVLNGIAVFASIDVLRIKGGVAERVCFGVLRMHYVIGLYNFWGWLGALSWQRRSILGAPLRSAIRENVEHVAL